MRPKPLPRHLRVLAAMYPRSFREMYGEGFISLLEDEKASPRVVLDLMLGALDAHLQTRRAGRSLPTLLLRFFIHTLLAGLYALVSFPLAVAYFIFVVTGMAMGGGLLITLAGILILALTILGVPHAARFERWLTSAVLNVDIPPPAPQASGPLFQLQQGRLSVSLRDLRDYFFGTETLKGFVYLLLKFPFSVASFAATLFLAATGGVLLSAPISHHFVDYELDALGRTWAVHGMTVSILPAMAGAGLLVACALAVNLFAFAWGEIARFLLGARPEVSEEMVAAS